jgi:nucleotide-binding universal stress UspA family protein
MRWSRLLVPLDGSSASEAALPYAEAIAQATGAPIHLLTVVDPVPIKDLAERRRMDEHGRMAEAPHGAVRSYLDSIAESLRQRGIRVTRHVASGDPMETIVADAMVEPASLIVMATDGRGGAERWIVGSVADKVMRLAACPTLLVRSPEPNTATGAVRLRRLLAPLDGSPLAETALPVAADLAQASGAELVLARVEPWLASRMGDFEFAGYAADIERMEGEVASAASNYLAQQRDRLPPSLAARTVLLRGTAATGLRDLIKQESIDLVVMSTHGRGGLRRLVLGSVADRLVRSGAPVLLVRPDTATSEATAHEAPAVGASSE